jgi:hypothetical protein
MTNMLDDVEFQIAKLQLAEEDFLVVRTAKPIPSTFAAELRARLERQVGRKVLVLDPGTELTVVAKAEMKRLAEGGKK